MITVDRYRQITGDFASADAEVTRCITDAQEALEEFLDRPLLAAERTEAMRPDRHGYLWPKATPIASADGYEIDGLAIIGAAPFGPAASFIDPDSSVSVTYTGGWTAETLPYAIQRDLAWAAHRLAHPSTAAQATQYPAGATSVRLGDAAVSFGSGGAGTVAAGSTDGWWSARTRGYRWAPLHNGPRTVHA